MNENLLSKYCLICVMLFLVASCAGSKKTPQDQAYLQIISEKNIFDNNVSFYISNVSESSILIESTVHFKLEYYNRKYKQWEELPYQPCKCGTPCIPPTVKNLAPGDSLSISWNRMKVECEYQESEPIPETISTYQKKGKYRMSFNYIKLENGIKSGREMLTYELRLK